MRDLSRFAATFLVWVTMAGLLGGLLTTPTGAISRVEDNTIVFMVMMLSAAAVISTAVIWLSGQRSARDDTLQSMSKTKRQQRNRMERLIEALEDDEIYDLEALLLARDQEHAEHRRAGPGAAP